jgi:soluble lytic murein transglycosylase-like protein
LVPSVGRSDDKGDSSKVSQETANAGPFENIIQEASQTFDVKRDLIRAVIRAESDFNPMAESRAGAVGLMQLLPSTARDMGVTNLYDPRENILGGTQYLGMLLERYEGNMEQALAAYNWGPGNLERAPDRLPQETRAYIQRVLSYLETLTV